jgi:hypothetical protein
LNSRTKLNPDQRLAFYHSVSKAFAMDYTNRTENVEEFAADHDSSIPLPASRSASSLDVSDDVVHDEDELSIALPASRSTSSLGSYNDEGRGKGDNSGNNDNEHGTLPTGREASGRTSSAQVVDGLKIVNGLMQKLGIASVASKLQQGQQHEALKKHPRALRTYESTHVDGARIVGDVRDNMAKMSYGRRLRHLGVLGGKKIRTQSLVFHGSETSVGPDAEPSPHISNMHINIPSVPGMVVFSPPHSPDAVRKGFRDPLMYHIQVSIAKINPTRNYILIMLIAPTPLHAFSCVSRKPRRGSRTLDES